MKKILIVGICIVGICLSSFAGNYISDKENHKEINQRSHSMIVFSIDKVEELKIKYDADIMEALISNVYAACEFTTDAELSSALHKLWNALIFDGENLVGKEDDLIKALQSFDPKTIEGLAYSIRMMQ